MGTIPTNYVSSYRAVAGGSGNDIRGESAGLLDATTQYRRSWSGAGLGALETGTKDARGRSSD